jgi:hypothetical protein
VCIRNANDVLCVRGCGCVCVYRDAMIMIDDDDDDLSELRTTKCRNILLLCVGEEI